MCLKKKSDGRIVVDLYSDDAPMRVYLNCGLGELATKKRIILDVDSSALYEIKNYTLDNETSEKEES